MIAAAPSGPRRSYRDRIDLSGRVVLVCGAGPGLGLEAARALRDCGAQVVCLDRDPERAEDAAREVGGMAVAADITRRDDARRAVGTAAALHGRLDGIVDIVGGSAGAWVEELDDEAVAREFAINFTHAHLVTQLGSEAIARSGGGTITFVGSIAGVSSLPRQAIYGSAKAALHHFVRYAASELGHLGVRVNAVAPGFVRTPRMLDRFSPEIWGEMGDAAPLGRPGDPDDIAGPLLFLSSDLSRFITGQVLVADGGITLALRASKDRSKLQLRGRTPK